MHIDRDTRLDVRETAGPEHLIISKFLVRQSQSRKIKVATMARTRQTVHVSKLVKISLEELATWRPKKRRAYSKGLWKVVEGVDCEKRHRKSQIEGSSREKDIIRDFCTQEESPKQAILGLLLSSKIPYNIFFLQDE